MKHFTSVFTNEPDCSVWQPGDSGARGWLADEKLQTKAMQILKDLNEQGYLEELERVKIQPLENKSSRAKEPTKNSVKNVPLSEDLERLIETHCIDCHGGKKVKGKFDFKDLMRFDNQSKWLSVYEAIERATCPNGQPGG